MKTSKARYVVPVLLFALVLCAHFIRAERRRIRRPDFDYTAGAWLAAARSYASGDKVWLGLSLATAAGFVAFWLKRPCKTRKQAIKGAGGGLAMATFLHGIGCFLLGCCGSPMLAVYVGLLGPRFAGLTGPINFGLTVASIAISCVWLKRRDRARCSCEGGDCPTEVPPGCKKDHTRKVQRSQLDSEPAEARQHVLGRPLRGGVVVGMAGDGGVLLGEERLAGA